MKVDKYLFLRNKVNDVKEELKSRKKWKKALMDEYCKARTQKNEITKKEVMKLISVAGIMVEEYEKIYASYKEMLERVEALDK